MPIIQAIIPGNLLKFKQYFAELLYTTYKSHSATLLHTNN